MGAIAAPMEAKPTFKAVLLMHSIHINQLLMRDFDTLTSNLEKRSFLLMVYQIF